MIEGVMVYREGSFDYKRPDRGSLNRRRKAFLQPNVAKLVNGAYLPEYATLMCVSEKAH